MGERPDGACRGNTHAGARPASSRQHQAGREEHGKGVSAGGAIIVIGEN
jgi:hypothetical protein